MTFKKYSIITAAVISIFILGFATGHYTAPTLVQNTVLREKGYSLINPILLCNNNVTESRKEDTTLSSKLQSYVSHAQETEVGVYYLSLGGSNSHGSWAGVNENKEFSPASMLKVPTLAATLRYADDHSGFLQKEIYYDGSFDDNTAEHYKPTKSIQPGRSYTIEELLIYMIEYSDNNAAKLLDLNSIPQNDLDKIYLNLDIQLPQSLGDIMSPETYSDFLRIFYNGTYLSRSNSEKALELMSKADFSYGLRGGVATSTVVAQKFGERVFAKPTGEIVGIELHDCGIVYTENPYLLCVMTRGSSFDTLAQEIRDISKIVFDYRKNE